MWPQPDEVMSINCHSCGNDPLDGDNYCRQCGEELPGQDTFECPECDAEIREEDNFCFSCGTKFEGTQEDMEQGSADTAQNSGFGQGL